MLLKTVFIALGLLFFTSVMAEDCLPGFGPGCVTPYPTPTVERIPIHPAALNPIWVGGQDYVTPQAQVVDNDFVLLTVTLPNGYRVGGLSNACVGAGPCPNLALFAYFNLRERMDNALRARP